ncbi:MAG: hypothetical protein HY769_05435 [Candidatus Stahlbacteria bacterium]|nr:hypothetical protein [Candidatus Stahlbacteria bacterium]
MKKLWLLVSVLFMIAFVYLWEYSLAVKLTFVSYNKTKQLSELSDKVEGLRIKGVILSSAQRIYNGQRTEDRGQKIEDRR